MELALWYAYFGLLFLFPSSPVRTLLQANTSLLLSTHLASQNQFPGKLWLLSVRRGFSRLRASPPCLGATPHTPALLIPVLYRQINYPHSSLVCTNFLPWFSAFNELPKTKSPGSQVRNVFTFWMANSQFQLWSRPGPLLLHVSWNSAECASGWEDMINSHRLQG